MPSRKTSITVRRPAEPPVLPMPTARFRFSNFAHISVNFYTIIFILGANLHQKLIPKNRGNDGYVLFLIVFSCTTSLRCCNLIILNYRQADIQLNWGSANTPQPISRRSSCVCALNQLENFPKSTAFPYRQNTYCTSKPSKHKTSGFIGVVSKVWGEEDACILNLYLWPFYGGYEIVLETISVLIWCRSTFIWNIFYFCWNIFFVSPRDFWGEIEVFGCYWATVTIFKLPDLVSAV